MATCLLPFYRFPATTNYEGGDNPTPNLHYFFGLPVYKPTPSSRVAILYNHPWLPPPAKGEDKKGVLCHKISNRRLHTKTKSNLFGSVEGVLLVLSTSHTVDGSEILHQLVGSLSHYLLVLILPRWCRTSSINSTKSSTICGNISALFFKHWTIKSKLW